MKLTGWTIEQIENTPAMTIDWILAFNNAELEIAAEREQAARSR